MRGLAVLLGRSLPCPDFYLGATVSTAVAVPPDGELTAKSQFQHPTAVKGHGFFRVLNGIAITVVKPVMGGDLIQVLAQRANHDAVSPHERSVSPPQSTA